MVATRFRQSPWLYYAFVVWLLMVTRTPTDAQSFCSSGHSHPQSACDYDCVGGCECEVTFGTSQCNDGERCVWAEHFKPDGGEPDCPYVCGVSYEFDCEYI